MKRAVILWIVLMIIPYFGYTQTIENLDYVGPLNNDLVAVKKGSQWAFINEKAEIVINFRNDLVPTKSDDGSYPIFKDGRCLIVKEKQGISYFGYIDTSGKTIVEPQYLNATSFYKNKAIVLKLIKKDVGENSLLGKDIVYYRYYEIIIDPNGKERNYLNPKGVSILFDSKHLQNPPKITSKQISEDLYVILNENKKRTVITIKK